jgi:hypothetical protein
MARVQFLADRFVIRNDGLRRLLTVAGSIPVRYEAIDSVKVGLDAVPPWYAWRLGFNPGVGSRRAGIFWWQGRKWFLDVSDTDRTVVVTLKPGAPYDAVALTVVDPHLIAQQIRSRIVHGDAAPA